MKWHFDNPAVALEEYYTDYNQFVEKKSTNELLEKELSDKEYELTSRRSELDTVKKKLQEMQEYTEEDLDSKIKKIEEQTSRKITDARKLFDDKKEKLAAKKEKDLKDNDQWLSDKLKQLLGEHAEANLELTALERKALEFEIDRRQYVMASDEKINKFQDEITQGLLECKSAVGEWKKEQDIISEKFAPGITDYKNIIDSINQKYLPDIHSYQALVAQKVEERDEEIRQLETERSREIQLANNEIAGYQKDYKQAEKQFSEQIRMAKLQNKPTTRMENSRTTRLNLLNDQIQKVNNRANMKIMKIDLRINEAQSKHAKYINKAEEQLNSVIQRRDQELEEPQKKYNCLVQDRDSQINVIQNKINQREVARDNQVEDLNNRIANEKSLQEKHHKEVDKQIIEFAMNGETCFSEVLDQTRAPFAVLQNKVDNWMKLLTAIKKDKLSSCYEAEHDKQKTELISRDYSGLTVALSEAQQFDGKLSSFAQNNGTLKIVGIVLGVVGIIMTVLLYIILKTPAAFSCLCIVAIGMVIEVLTIVKTNKEFSAICRYISIASDYEEFPSISAHSTQVAQERELSEMKNLGNKLFDVHYGKEEAQKIHDSKDADIKSDYKRDIKLITVELEETKAEYERSRDKKIAHIKGDASSEKDKFNSEKETVQNTFHMLSQKVSAIEKSIETLKSDMKDNKIFIQAFEDNYRILDEKLQDGKWMAPMNFTHGKLSNVLFIIPEKNSLDAYGHKGVYQIVHNKKPLVVTYDISDIDETNTSLIEEIGKIIHDLLFDLMYSVYRMNNKESYVQLVVDEIGGSNELKSSTVKNAFNIMAVAGRIDEVRGRIKEFGNQREKLAEKGARIDDINEKKYDDQERPEVYNIMYIIYKPNEHKSKLDEDIRKLIPECDKYGFLPIFICDNETWNRESSEKDSMYKDIRSMLSNPVVSYDGKQYVS